MNVGIIKRYTLFFLLIPLLSFSTCFAKGLKIYDAKTNGQYSPLGMGTTNPIFSWKLKSKHRNKSQQSYQIVVLSDCGDLLWDSNRVKSDNNILVKYDGKRLSSNQDCKWKVKVWDNHGVESAWSTYSHFHTGLMNEKEWKAKWITTTKPIYSPLYLNEFEISSTLKSAYCYVNCQGFFELYVNGQKVGKDILSPAVSDYRYENYYLTYDIRKYLKKGKNRIGIWTGKGWYSKGLPGVDQPSAVFRLQAHLSYSNNEQLVVSDTHWKSAESNLQRVGRWRWNRMGGELFDDRISMKQWTENRAAFRWTDVSVVDSCPATTSAQICPVNILSERIKVKEITALNKGEWLIDFGKNFTGWMKMRVQNRFAHDTINFIYSDFCDQTPEQISKYEWNFGTRIIRQWDAYIPSDRKEGVFCPKFNYHAFRYVIVQGVNYKPKPEDFEGIMIESDLETVGGFTSSDSDLNAIYTLNRFTYRCLDNGGYFVDCPHRERLGYGADGQVAIETGIYSFNTYNFYKKWARNWMVNQEQDGNFKHTAPSPYGAGGGPAWGAMGVILPWKLYKYYGDIDFLRKSFQHMKRYVAFLDSKFVDGVLKPYGKNTKWGFIGDWLPPGRGMNSKNRLNNEERELFNNCYMVYLYEMLSKSAQVLEYKEDQQKYKNLATSLKGRINECYYHSKDTIYADGGQTYLSFPLLMKVPESDDYQKVLEKLEHEIKVAKNGHLDTGMLGTYFMLQLLTDIGRSDLTYLMMKQTTYPGWGYMVAQGANTCWEQWDGFWSNIHACFTSGGGWFYRGVGGILQKENSSAFKSILIKPQLIDSIQSQSTYFNSPYGRIEVAWKRDKKGNLQYDIEIPVNTKAEIHLPVAMNKKVYESGKIIGRDITIVDRNKHTTTLEVSSGKYVFTIK
ncbi:glycoside hydrolase family 78 protein [Halosquirtibacter xylanolyticus]|uniref:family 78 glycoside hydrolase catalytic domain n=1 Tax=Halosquirtibacter xylanolyticus TaxID=3374599 RepID=UPI00374A1DAE|nr:glycoside hydrolase family 78 protein [Prolixibacteraceae bacterium]